MNISKLAAAAIKMMPKTVTKNQMLGAALFGGGLLAGSLFRCGGEEEKKIGDNFEKQKQVEQKADTIQAKPQEAKADTVAIPTAENYDKVQIGKHGIASADTTYWIGTDKIGTIYFYEDKDKKRLVHRADFDKNGKLEAYGWFDPDKKNAKGAYTDFSMYNAKDEKVLNSFTSEENDWRYVRYPQDCEKAYQTYEKQYDKNGNLRVLKMHLGKYYPELENSSLEVQETYYELDGSYREENYRRGDDYIEYFDKNGRLLKKKVLGQKDVLKYTVVPKYDKEGTLIKNDTIKNEQ